MSGFGKTLFGGGSFLKWALSPFVLLFLIVMPLTVETWTVKLGIMTGVMELMGLALLGGLWLPGRLGHGSFRTLAGLVFLTYAGYLIYEFFFSGQTFHWTGGRSSASPRSALLGFIFIGLPSLWYALFGRMTLRPETNEDWDDELADDSAGEYAVTVVLKLSDPHSGSPDERAAIQALAHTLEAAIVAQGVGTYDGDEFGGGEGTLYFQGPDAERLFAVIKPLLQAAAIARGAKVILNLDGEIEERPL